VSARALPARMAGAPRELGESVVDERGLELWEQWF